MDNKNIKTTDWLVKGISKKRLKKEKIQALKKEIKYLEAELTVCNEALDNSIKLNNRLQAESERLSRAVKRLTNRVCDLKEKDETRHKVFMTKCEELETAKTEAYKECIEKVKEYYKNKLQNYQFNYDAYCKLCEDLDNLLKELVGGNK